MEQSSIHDHYDLLISLLHLERQLAENESALRQAKYDLREAKVAEAEYSGSFRALRDRLTGKQEAAETALRHAVQTAEAHLASTRQQKEALDAQLAEGKAQLSVCPAWEVLRDGSREWYRLEALLCMETVAPLLEISRDLLTRRRNQFNGTYAGQIKTRQELAQIYSAPEAAGEACKPYLLRLQEALAHLEISLDLHRCFLDPTAFLSCATQFNRMDRVNEAIAQVEAMQHLLPGLQKQLEESQ